MSTEERWTHVRGKCPCGSGTVTEEVVSPDNAWSRTLRYPSINCAKCAEEWDLSEDKLVLKSSREAVGPADTELNQVLHQIKSVQDKVMAGYFARRFLSTMKAEWEEMTRLGFYKESLATFRNRRGSPPDHVYQFWGLDVSEEWLLTEAAQTNARQRREELYARKAEKLAALQAANCKVVSVTFNDLVPAEGERIIEDK